MANQWGDEELQASAITLAPGQDMPVNEWGDEVAADVVVRADPAAAITPQAELQPAGRSTITGMTPNEAQARGKAGGAALQQAVVESAPTALRIGAVLGASTLATPGAGLGLNMLLAGAGAAAAEYPAQKLEQFAGQRKDLSFSEGVINTAAGTTAPLAGALGTKAITAATGMKLASSPAMTLGQRATAAGIRGLEGATVNTVHDTAMRASQGREITPGTVGTAAATGFGFGAVLGTAFDELARANTLNKMRDTARAAGYQGEGGVDDLRTWWNQRAAAPKPAPQWDYVPPEPSATGPLATRQPSAVIDIESPVTRALTRTAAQPAPELLRITGGRPLLTALSTTVDTAPAPTVLDNLSAELPAPSVVAPSPALAPQPTPTKGSRLSFGARADGTDDLIDHITALGGVPRPPANAAGRGEWDGYAETFRGPARLLQGRAEGRIDSFVQELNETFGYKFQSVDDFKAAIAPAIAQRAKLKTTVEAEQATNNFQAAALENTGRSFAHKADAPRGVDDLYPGDQFKVKGHDFTVSAIKEDGNVIVKDGPKFGTQELPAGQVFYPDKGSVVTKPRAEPVFNDWGDELVVDTATTSVAATPEPAQSDGYALQAATPEQLAAEAEARRAAEQTLAQREAIATRQDAPLTGDSSDVGQGALFNEGADLFSGPSAESMATTASFDKLFSVLKTETTSRGVKLGVASGADKFIAIQLMLDPKSILPPEFKTAVRFSEQAQAGITRRAVGIQADLRKAIDSVKTTHPAASASVMAYMTGSQPLAALPPAVRYPAQAARDFVDALSDRAIREGVVSGDLAQKFTDNLGTYLRRSYELFANPNYFPAPGVRQAALDFVRNNWKPGQVLSVNEGEIIIGQLLDREAAGEFMTGGRIAGRDVGSLIARQDLAPEIRALYGEITDPVEAFGQTVPRLAKLIENHAAQQWMKLVGLRTGFFTQGPTPLNIRPVVSDTSKPHEVWQGLYTFPAMADALKKEANNGRAWSVQEAAGQLIRSATSLAKISKTVLNPDSYTPNFVGGLISAAANGNFNVLPLGRGLMISAEDLGALRTAGVLPQTRAALKSDIEKLARLGLRNEGVSGADLLQTWERSLLPAALGKVGKWIAPTLKGYGEIDSITKYMGWKGELARLQKVYPTMRLDAAERMAAERIRATMPTYSEIPKFIRQLSQLGISPSFVSFTWEMFRTTANTARIAANDIAEGIRTGNTTQTADGARRAAALFTVLAASSAAGLTLLSRRENNITEEQDAALRFFGPSWNKEGQLFYNTPIENGKVQSSNVSYLLPHALLFESFSAGMRGDTPEKMTASFLNQLKQQFLSADGGVLLGPAMEAFVGNNRETGRPVVNRESPTPTADAFKYLYDKSLHPLALDKLDRIIKANRNEQGPGGRVYSIEEEGKRLLGMRAQTTDFNQAAEFKARDLARRFTDASNLYRSMRSRNVPPTELEAAYQRGEQARQRVFSDVQDYLRFGKVAGVAEDNLIKHLRDAGGLGPQVVLGALDGKYSPQDRDKTEAASDAVDRLGTLPSEQVKREILTLATSDLPKLKSIAREVETRAKGITQKDRLILALDVANGERAKYITAQVMALPDMQARAGYIAELRRKSILTDDVAKQLGK